MRERFPDAFLTFRVSIAVKRSVNPSAFKVTRVKKLNRLPCVPGTDLVASHACLNLRV